MASYSELFDIRNNGPLRNKIMIAITVKAQTIIDLASPSANQITWASNAILDAVKMADKIMPYVLAANKAATVAQIVGASDASVQTNVDLAVDKLIAGGITS